MDIDERLEESIENKYMQDDKGKNKMKLTAEESFYILKRRDFNSYVEEKAIQTVSEELEKKDKIIDKIYDFCRRELAFEKRLKREKRKPDEFNQGRFYVCENIKAIITNKIEEEKK